jgi:GxxExxY protein
MVNDPLTYKVIGCAMEVHRELGCGFQEVIYQKALSLEFERVGLAYSREQVHPVLFKNQHVGTRRSDFVVEGKVLIELKAVYLIEPVHIVQAKNYTKIFGIDKCLLINFGNVSLVTKLIFNPDYKMPEDNP